MRIPNRQQCVGDPMKRPRMRWRPRPKVTTVASKWAGAFTVEVWMTKCGQFKVTRQEFEDSIPYTTITAEHGYSMLRDGDRQEVRYFRSVKAAMLACAGVAGCQTILPTVSKSVNPIRLGHQGPFTGE